MRATGIGLATVSELRRIGFRGASEEAIARLQLTARRLGGRICVRHAPAKLEDLLRLTGLAEICGLLSVLEREAEEREDPLGVEEEGQLDDSPA